MPRDPRKQWDVWAQVGFYTSLGFILPLSAAGGFGIGWMLDRWLKTSPIFAVVLSFIGAAGGFVEILRIMQRAEKRGDGSDSDSGPGAG